MELLFPCSLAACPIQEAVGCVGRAGSRASPACPALQLCCPPCPACPRLCRAPSHLLRPTGCHCQSSTGTNLSSTLSSGRSKYLIRHLSQTRSLTTYLFLFFLETQFSSVSIVSSTFSFTHVKWHKREDTRALKQPCLLVKFLMFLQIQFRNQ